ncbi:hypothetical protein JRO89_XS10G0217000 [Xanthoceras sorbifolium]|uniref:Cytoplasmic tRNA 2-thiolation protein 2 n=1 Tax=Xanthoceras sorbifolium TaxID=99658 RepID=A0ABQ8HK03_9ROSI|nr:hypothetical protein JRO89_XS10G0217000 [Xanthoceras sorbifolium]
MACDSSTCQSNCYKRQLVEEEPIASKSGDSNKQSVCVKCKAKEAVSGAGEDGRFCRECFRSNLYGKFKLAVTSNAMITPSDNVLVAFSGGPSSRVVLQFIHEMQQRAQKNFDASKDRSLPVFGVGVTYVDESAYHSVPSCEIDEAIEDIRSIVSNLAPPAKELHIVPIEGVFALDSLDCERERLKTLLDSVSDATGKEDLLLHLRMLTLQKRRSAAFDGVVQDVFTHKYLRLQVASENGYNRLVLGLCTSRIACHVITATVKGQGYSLPADIQYVDARWEVPVVLPLRDCLASELNMFCHLDGLKTLEFSNGPCSGINGLVSSFVKLLQEENPSRECTIVRTAGKLTPFHFNRIPELNDSNVPLATRRRQKRFNLKPSESICSESFCPLCFSPLSKSELLSLSSFESCQDYDILGAACSSCRFQIFPKDPSSMEHFYSVLPQPLLIRAKKCSNGNRSLLR